MKYLNAMQTEIKLPSNTLSVISVHMLVEKIKIAVPLMEFEYFKILPRPEQGNYCCYMPALPKLIFNPSKKKRRFEICISTVEHL